MAQELGEQAEIRAADLLVAIERRSGVLRRSWPVRFSVEDFHVTLGGEEVTVLSIDESFEAAAREPWQILVYVDAAISSNDLVRSATGLLAGAAAELVALGSVEVILADPDPGLLLAATRDETRLNETLAGLSLGSWGGDRLVSQRSELLDLPDVADDLLELGLEDEIQTVRRQVDRLLTWLTGSARGSSRRALLLVSGGFDLEPEAFYQALSRGSMSGGSSRLTDLHGQLVRAIAAGEWVTFSLRRPEPDPLPRRWGLRRSLLVRADGNWDPERAEAYFELGESLIAQGKWKAAEEALRSAAYHYYSQPKLRPRQAEALLRLAYVLEQQDRRFEADKVSRKAIHLDPTVASRVTLAGLLDPVAPLALLAEATSGGLISDRQGLADVLIGLARRLRVEYQVGDPTRGEPIPVAVTFDVVGYEAMSVGWAPGGSPSLVARARSRRLLEDDLDVAIAGDQRLTPATLDVSCGFVDLAEGSSRGDARLEVGVDPGLGPEWEGLATRLRVTVSSWVGDAIATIQVTGDEQVWHPGDEFRIAVDLVATVDDPELAVVIEEMTTERWFATFSGCEPANE